MSDVLKKVLCYKTKQSLSRLVYIGRSWSRTQVILKHIYSFQILIVLQRLNFIVCNTTSQPFQCVVAQAFINSYFNFGSLAIGEVVSVKAVHSVRLELRFHINNITYIKKRFLHRPRT
jgi:hypothetical protein